VDETTWHNVKSWNLSDYFKENLKKGRKFYVEGRISKRDYMDKENIKRYAMEVISERLIPLDSSGDADESGSAVTAPEVNVEDNEDLPF
jgi:single-strand DNA-binding protein